MSSNTWQGRLKAFMGSRGYQVGMRRSLQTIILLEAKRSIESRLKSLRPYQRKAAFMEQCFYLLESLDFIFPNQKPEILWRTMTSRVPLDGETAWSRLKGINRELAGFCEKIKPLMVHGRTHQEAVDLMVQEMYQGKDESNKGKTCPWTWEHAHNHVIMAFRLYYKGDKFDPTFPPPSMCPEMNVPQIRPKKLPEPDTHTQPERVERNLKHSPHQQQQVYVPKAVPVAPSHEEAYEPALDVEAILGETSSTKPAEDRRQMLKEVREHLELLKEFEGVIPEEEIARRKRELFMALPSAPVPFSKKPKL